MATIRQQTNNGADLATFMVRVFNGKVKGARIGDRIAAATWLADRAYGKPIAAPDLYRVLTEEQANALIGSVVESVRRNVSDPAVLAAIGADIGRLVQRYNGRPPEHPAAS